MSKRVRVHAANNDEKSTDRVFTLYLQHEDDPRKAGRKAADEAFDGLAAAIRAIVAQQKQAQEQPQHA